MIPKHNLAKYLTSESRCPHCAIDKPALEQYWVSHTLIERGTPGPRHRWAVYACHSCGGMVLAKGVANEDSDRAGIIATFPSPRTIHADIPDPARRFLQQAVETLHAPDAAAMVAGSAVDAMLKTLGYEKGSVYERIEKAVSDHKLTEDMGAWAHEVRLGSNRPRHADAEKPHVEPAEAKQSVEFAEALAFFLFVLTKRIERGKKAAEAASNPIVQP